MRQLTSTLGDVRQDIVHQSVDDESNNIVSKIDQELMPALRFIRLDSKVSDRYTKHGRLETYRVHQGDDT
jgi:hypothetical protein